MAKTLAQPLTYIDDGAGKLVFRIRGATRFTDMPLDRVARYMRLVAGIVGPKARFVRMTPTQIVMEAPRGSR